MWIERVLRNVGDVAAVTRPGQALDFLDLNWDQCARRAIKAASRGNRAVRGLLPASMTLAHGDVLADDADVLLIVNVRDCEVLVAQPHSPRDLARVALELGNLHWPTAIGESEIVCPFDAAVADLLTALNVKWLSESRRFEPCPVLSLPQMQLAHELAVRSRPSAIAPA